MRFWLIYLLAALSGTVVVHIGAPSFTAQAAQWARRYAAAPQEAAPAQPRVLAPVPPPPVPPPVPPRVQQPRQAPAAEPSREAVAATPAVDVAAAAVPGVAATTDTAVTVTQEEPAPPPMAAVDDGAVQASAEPVRQLYQPPAADPDAISWGIVAQKAPYSGANGNNLGYLPAGTVLEIRELKTTARGDKAVCAVDDNGQWKGPVLVGLEDMVRFDGPLTDAPPAALDLLYRYYRLKGQIDERQTELRRRVMPANPHEAEYNDAVARLKAFDQKVDAMVKERDTASGPRRSKLIEELHGMKYEMNRLKYAVEQADGKRREWAKQHPPPAVLPRDPQLEEWQAELRRLEPEKRTFVD